MDTLFTDKLPIVKTNAELEAVFHLYPKYDRHYVATGCIQDRREQFDKLRQIYHKFADTHFAYNYKLQFHQRSREMYVGSMLIRNLFDIKSTDEGPDFIVNENIYVECVACTKGEEGKQLTVPTLELDGSVQEFPEYSILSRMTNSIVKKHIKYIDQWSSKERFNDSVPFIIALNTGDLAHIQDQHLILKPLFGLGHLIYSKNIAVEPQYSFRPYIEKGEEKIPSMLFEDPTYADISAIIWSPRMVIDHPAKIGDDCIFVHNPNAKNPISLDVFHFIDQWVAEGDQLICHKAA